MYRIVLIALALLISAPAVAYIGPGAGISVLGSLLGILATIVVAIGAIVMWPLRKMLKKRRQAAAEAGESSNPEMATETAPEEQASRPADSESA